MSKLFRTELTLTKGLNTITHDDKIVSLGSCFSENIGNKLGYYQFDIDINPHGILFNPISICKSLYDILEEKKYEERDLDSFRDVFFSYHHHSSFSSLNAKDVIEVANERIRKASSQLKESKFLMITLGSAFVYRNKISGELVANCHKVPNYNFDKKLLSHEEIVESFWDVLIKIKQINPTIQVIFTLSPVRHVKEGIIENNRSKAILLSVIHKLVDDFENVNYFPSYEIMMDDLRDYRFYEKDMIHPSSLAIDYIWNKFSEVYFTEETIKIKKEIESIKKDLAHKPFNTSSEDFIKFKDSLASKIEIFTNSYPNVKPFLIN
jgi:hypothetical protein